MEDIYINLEDKISRKFFDKDFVSVNEVLDKLSELEDERDNLKEELNNLKQNLEENYRPIPQSQLNGISDRDFI